MERYCPTCNIPGKGRFCLKCGKPLVVGTVATTSGDTALSTAAPDTEPTFVFTQLGTCNCGEAKIKKDGKCKACDAVRIAPCSLCEEGADKIDSDGSCACGNRRLPKPSDHDEIALGPYFASVCDRGIKHSYQQDRHGATVVPVEKGNAAVFVIADGVSGSSKGGEAAEAAVKAAIASAANSLSHGMATENCVVESIRAAQDGVLRLLWKPINEKDQQPCSTILVAIKIGAKLTWGWLGDTRLGWVTDSKCGWLVKDDSWINAQRDFGTPEAAIREALAKDHSLSRAVVRNLGSSQGEPSKLDPHVQSCDVPAGCTFVGCTDGFHVYADSPEQLAAVIRQQKGASALATARALVEFAKAKGGADNITISILTDAA